MNNYFDTVGFQRDFQRFMRGIDNLTKSNELIASKLEKVASLLESKDDNFKFMVVSEIEWDTDSDNVCLPRQVLLPDILAKRANEEGFDEVVSDWLSDEFGFCHKGFKLTKV